MLFEGGYAGGMDIYSGLVLEIPLGLTHEVWQCFTAQCQTYRRDKPCATTHIDKHKLFDGAYAGGRDL